MRQQMDFLEAKYGEPTKTEIVTLQNSYGAKWDCFHATWNMPDGAIILAIESIENLPMSGPTRWLKVTFLSKARGQELAAEGSKPNPY
jgi:hypothetical protein